MTWRGKHPAAPAARQAKLLEAEAPVASSLAAGAPIMRDQAAEILSTRAWRFDRNQGRSVPCTQSFEMASPG